MSSLRYVCFLSFTVEESHLKIFNSLICLEKHWSVTVTTAANSKTCGLSKLKWTLYLEGTLLLKV